MNADVFFSIGSTHHVCQDYAIAKNTEKPYVILSDGCSSAPDTDFGSRLIAKAAEPHVFKETSLLCKETLSDVLTFAKAMKLNESSLLATLLVLKSEEDRFESLCVGDGAIVGFGKDGLVIIEYAYKSGAPYYLAYERPATPFIANGKQVAPSSEVDAYFAEFGGNFTKTTTLVKPDGSVKCVKVENQIGRSLPYTSPYFVDKWPYDAYSMVAVMSDGVQSFVEVTKTPTTGIETHSIPAVQVLQELMAFKNTTGKFVLRRCQKAFKTFKDKNWQHMDDVSVGAITK